MTLLVDTPPTPESNRQIGDAEIAPNSPRTKLVQWVMSRVDPWRELRDQNHKKDWERNYRVWRAKYAPEDKTRGSERSQMVTPATMAAVDATTAEIEEAIFGRDQWFDIEDDAKEQLQPDFVDQMLLTRDLMKESLDEARVPRSVCRTLLMGSIWGTGIAKVNTYKKRERKPAGGNKVSVTEKMVVELVPIEPSQFVPDPSAESIDDMLGCAHEPMEPLHKVRALIKDGTYFKDVKIQSYGGADSPPVSRLWSYSTASNPEAVWITEWHGLVPAKYIALINQPGPESEALWADANPDDELVEAIVTIGNKSILLGALRNPFYCEDRCVIAYQHDTVPGDFWGRGVPEKADNSQRQLDGTIRARNDAMALVASPMWAGDPTKLPKGFKLAAWAGRFWPTQGDPREVISRLDLGTVNPELFAHAQDAERMVALATGAMDPAGQYNPNDQSATNTALNTGNFLKKVKRTVRCIDQDFLQQFVRKATWRFMQFDPDNYPEDYEFTTAGTAAIIARELEMQMLIQLISLVPMGTPPYYIILKAIFELSASAQKRQMLRAIDTQINPPQPKEGTPEFQEQQEQKALQKRSAEAAVAVVEAQAMDRKASAMLKMKQAQSQEVLDQETIRRMDMDSDRLDLEHIHAVTDMRKVAGLEMQNKETAVSSQMRAQELAIQGLDKGLSAERIITESNKLDQDARLGASTDLRSAT